MIMFLILTFKEQMYQEHLKKVQQQRWERQQVYITYKVNNITNIVFILEMKIKSFIFTDFVGNNDNYYQFS